MVVCEFCSEPVLRSYQFHVKKYHPEKYDEFRKVEEMELIKEKKDEDGELIYSCSVCDERIFRKKDMGGHLLTSHFDLYEQLKQPGDDAELEERRVSLHPKALKRHKHLIHNQSVRVTSARSARYVCLPENPVEPLPLHLFNRGNCSSLEELESRRLLESVKFGKRKANWKGGRRERRCEHCGICTRDAHVRKIHLNQRFICDICDKEEPTGGKLWSHKVTSHPEVETPAPEGMVVCEYCSKPVLRNYQQHVEKFHPKKLAEFKKKGSYIQITKGDNGRSRSKCPECGKEVRYLRHHIKIVHGHGWELRPCQHCQKEFKTNSELNEHIRTRHTFESFERKVEAMKLIKQTPTDKGQPSLSCSLCDANLFSRKDMVHLLSAHFEVYEQLKNTEYEDLWKCGECSERLIQSNSSPLMFKGVILPPRFTAPSSDVTNYSQCSRCDAKFLQKPKLVEHVRSEHPGNYWPCHHCDLFGYSEQVLKNHLPKCDKNPDKQVPVVKIEKKKCSKTKISKKKRLREESETEEETESDDDTKRSKSLMEMETRSSSRIEIKRDKKRVKKLKAKVAQGSLDDDKLKMEVKVRVERLTKEQIDFHISTK
ncbi:Zinc finger protein-likeXfin [Orchesella cincta]|uniref:Zinc finger protein-likeXfin n=1 Tax=Orchesella cincta TaxID=48709 RepID=A0A1D2M0K9_ORCCI|nr:Zinc finger protein-likeXfin [Orchesella cincta]